MTTIRPATPADRDALLALLPELAAFPLPAWRTAAQIAGADTRILLDALDRPDPGTLILVGDVGGTITGFIFTTTRADYFTGRPTRTSRSWWSAPRPAGRGSPAG